MVNSIYQILLLGCNKELLPVVRSKLEKSLSDMQITDESYKFINTETFAEESLGVNPTIALYFTSDVNSDKDINLISTLKKHSIFIIPIVDSFDNAGLLLPDSLKEINAARVVDKNDEEGIVEVINHVLSNLGLLTKERFPELLHYCNVMYETLPIILKGVYDLRIDKDARRLAAIAIVAGGYGGDMPEEQCYDLLDDMDFYYNKVKCKKIERMLPELSKMVIAESIHLS